MNVPSAGRGFRMAQISSSIMHRGCTQSRGPSAVPAVGRASTIAPISSPTKTFTAGWNPLSVGSMRGASAALPWPHTAPINKGSPCECPSGEGVGVGKSFGYWSSFFTHWRTHTGWSTVTRIVQRPDDPSICRAGMHSRSSCFFEACDEQA